MRLKTISSAVLALALSTSSFAFDLSSKDIAEGEKMTNTFVFKGFGCEGENQSPQLSWSNVPKGTKSFAVTAYDPDAPTGSGWWHWVVVDIPASTKSLDRGVDVASIKAKGIKNDFGMTDFGGACPPEGHGMHRYQFTVWALPTEKLGIPEGASPALVGFMLNGSALGSAKLTSTYSR